MKKSKDPRLLRESLHFIPNEYKGNVTKISRDSYREVSCIFFKAFHIIKLQKIMMAIFKSLFTKLKSTLR